jgi:hypothetical protein
MALSVVVAEMKEEEEEREQSVQKHCVKVPEYLKIKTRIQLE